MGVILKFSDAEARSRFVSRLAAERPELSQGLRVARSNETMATLETRTAEDDAELRALVEPGTRVYEDVQFETFR